MREIRKLTDTGYVVYKAEHKDCRRFPDPGDETLKAGVNRNFQVFDPLDFIAEITQHIPERGVHTIRYYGWYSNKARGVRAKCVNIAEQEVYLTEEDTLDRKFARSRWAALIKRVFEVDPLICPHCGKEMRIIAFIEKHNQYDLIERILKHCNLWREPAKRACPEFNRRAPPKFTLEPTYIPMDEFLANF